MSKDFSIASAWSCIRPCFNLQMYFNLTDSVISVCSVVQQYAKPLEIKTMQRACCVRTFTNCRMNNSKMQKLLTSSTSWPVSHLFTLLFLWYFTINVWRIDVTWCTFYGSYFLKAVILSNKRGNAEHTAYKCTNGLPYIKHAGSERHIL